MKKYLISFVLFSAACVPPGEESDAGTHDAGSIDAGVIDAGTPDAGFIDAGERDAGEIDAGIPDAGCAPGETRDCYDGPAGTLEVGACVAGTQTCDSDAGWAACVGAVEPITEVCDGTDNDCDGFTDEGTENASCTTNLPGVCSMGETSCGGSSGPTCQQTVFSTAELCDNADNDCDGDVDENNPGGGQPCTTTLPGRCSAGSTSCDGGSIACVQNLQPVNETCDGVDNDCDGAVDENNPGGGAPCNTGAVGVCSAGTITCVGGSIECVSNTPSSAEVCDGQDNNCNGTVDEGLNSSPCNTGLLGVCGAGALSCIGGNGTCTQTTQPSAEVCDNLDNNCNGVKDEGVCDGGM